MSERYTRLHTLPENLYMDGAPILITAGALLKDNKTGRVLAQLKLRNLNQLPLVACKVSIRAFDPSGEELPGVESYSYLDITVSRGEDFGSKEPVYLPDSTTRNISIAVIQAVFEDGNVWRHPAEEWKPLPQNRLRITDADRFSDVELQKQYALEVGGNCEYVPVVNGSLFLCTCGAINLSTDEVCSVCGRNTADLLSALDSTELIRKKDARLAREEAERAERLERERIETEERLKREKIEAEERLKREKIAVEEWKARERAVAAARRRAGRCVSLVAVIGIVIAVVVTKVIVPGNKYKAAEKSLATENYDAAISVFEELGDYRDSTERILDCIYAKADKLLATGDYDAAILVFEELEDYKDSNERLLECVYAKADDRYAKADELLAAGDYDAAILVFEELGDYKDSNERLLECIYAKADKLLAAGNYDAAISTFIKYANDRLTDIQAAIYQRAGEFELLGDYDSAIQAYTKIINYSDSRQKISDLTFKKLGLRNPHKN